MTLGISESQPTPYIYIYIYIYIYSDLAIVNVFVRFTSASFRSDSAVCGMNFDSFGFNCRP